MNPSTPPEALSPKALADIAEFNRRQYFQSHETLEHEWRGEEGQTRALLHGIIQLAVGLLHVERANFKGATGLLNKAVHKFQGLPSKYQGIDVAALLASAERTYLTVVTLGPVGIAKFPWDEAPQVRFVTSE
ncbi:MAG: hypothetical protein HW397_553 [Dehalococcoidia bacterium]|nr:hypothetical protein [Dehalococcoidia bacterium]